MAQVPTPTPYRVIYDLLVEHVSGRNDEDRFLWLENGELQSLIPYLTAKQQGNLFARELLIAAYLHDDDADSNLRQLLTLLHNTYIGHPDIVAQINDILSAPDLRPLLFPAGLPDTDNPTLLRALARFRQMPHTPETSLPDIAPLPPPHHMRLDRNIDFVGRETELKAIAQAIKSGRGAVVAAGIGGVGKTQTAIEWVHRYGQYFAGGVFWLDFRDAATARLSIATAGIAYGWESYNALDLDTQIAKLRNQWNAPLPTLLVFDNCEDITLAYEYLPVGSGAKVLVTSRNTTWQAQVGNRGIMQVEIVTLPRSDSIALLQRLYPSLSSPHADELAKIVGDLPLALHLAGSYLAKYQGTAFGEPATYLEALKANVVHQLESSAARLKRRPSPTDHTLSVRATFELSRERLRTEADSLSELAERLLGLLAHFAPGVVVPEAWLQVELPEGANEEDVIDALELLQSSGLIERVQAKDLRLHRLIAEMVKDQQVDETRVTLGKQVDRALSKVYPTYGALNYSAQMEEWLPHARYRGDDAIQRRDKEAAELLNWLGIGLQHLAQYLEAIHSLTEALAICKEVLGEQHPDTALSLNNLAALYQSQGEYGRALPLYEQALAIRKEVLGERHPDTARSLNNLAALYRAQGEYGRALPLFELALAIRKEVLGERHPDTARSLNNLAALYRAQGEYGRALPLFELALAIYQEVLGERHPDTATSLNNLAYLYRAQGEYGRALPLFEQALAICKEVLGERHPDTARSLNNLAALYQFQGEYGRALPLFEQALAIYQEVLGERHPDTATSLNNLAALYQSQGEYGRALPLFELALAICKEVLGERHPDTALSLNNLAYLYRAQGEYGRALPLFELALTTFTTLLGTDHPNTIIVLQNLDRCRQMLGLPPLE